MTPAKDSKGKRALIEAVAASTIGTTIEWYDFLLYGTAAASVFPKLFFPKYDPFVGQILAFGTFTMGFLARPLGGVIFGYLGDRVGRKSTLVATLLLMGLSTLLIGFLPTYSQIGVAAPLLLTFLRLLQGLGVGGEWGGAVLLALEYGHRGRRGFFASWPQIGVPLGLLAATGAVAFMESSLSEEDFLDWGWRVPFYLSGLLIAVGLLIRLRIMETPLFQKLKESNQVAKAPVSEVLRRHWREVLLAAGARFSENTCFYLFSVFSITYVKDVLHVESAVIFRAINIAAAVELFAIPLFGMLSDLWSRKTMFYLGNLFLIAFAGPYFLLLDTREPIWITCAVVVSFIGPHALLYSVQASLIPELFGTRLRYTGASLGYQLATPFAGGLALPLAAWLIKTFDQHYFPLMVYIVVVALISLVSVHFLAETSRKDIGGG